MIPENILPKVVDYVHSVFKEQNPAYNLYHNIVHTAEVVHATEFLARSNNIGEEEIEILLVAAWFHDLGYIRTDMGHEEISVEMATDFLTKNNFPEKKILQVKSCIMSTKIPHDPKNIMEEIICDADLYHLGIKEFFDKNELLRLEVEKKMNKTFSDYDWLKNTLEFFTRQKYFTQAAKEKYDEQRNANLLKLQKRLRKKLSKREEDKVRVEKIKLEKEKLVTKKESDKKADRGIETMFRNVMRTHVSFSSMADTKANIMISVNTLLLGAIATILARKLDSNPHLIVPTLVLSLVSLTTLIFAILVTRPHITSGLFTKEDIEKNRANLLFFGNFYNMPLEDFHWGMTEMINNKKYLYDSMIKDFYYLGQVLGVKYKYLRICYNIFMYGIIISIVVFGIYIYMYPEGAASIGSIIE